MTSTRTVDVAELIEVPKPGSLQISTIAWLCALMVLEGYDMQVLSPAAPAIMREWNVSRADFGWVLSANVLGYMIGALSLSVFGDRFGRKKMIVLGTVIFGTFTFIAPLANVFTGRAVLDALAALGLHSTNSPEVAGLLTLRILAGIGLGGSIPAAIALAAEYTPSRMRATAIGLMYVGYTMGAALGGFLAAWTIADFGWPSVFYVGGAAAFPMCLCLALALPESARFLALKPELQPRVVALARRLRPGLDVTNVRFTVTEEVRRSSPRHLFTDGRLGLTSLLWCAFVTSFMGHYFLTGWLPTVLADAGLTLAQASFASGFFQMGGALGSLLIGILLDRWGMKTVAATFFLAAPFVASLGILSVSGYALVPFVFIAGMFVLGGQIGLNAVAGTVYPTYIRTTGAGWALGVGRIGSISGPIIGGHLIAAGFSRPVLFLLTAVPLFCCAVAMSVLVVQRNHYRRRAFSEGAAPLDDAREFVH